MGKIPILTQTQKIVLDEVKNNFWLKENFYLSGGTALSAFYLQHRYSDDLDFFSEDKYNNENLFSLISDWGKKHNFTFQSRFVDVVYKFNLYFERNQNLTIDFAYYPYKKLDKELDFEGIRIDSLLDITVNKMLVVEQRTDVKDFVDLFFLLKKYPVSDLITGVKEKFQVEVDPLLLAADLLKVEDFEYLPRMTEPLAIEDLRSYFRGKAKELGEKSVR